METDLGCRHCLTNADCLIPSRGLTGYINSGYWTLPFLQESHAGRRKRLKPGSREELVFGRDFSVLKTC